MSDNLDTVAIPQLELTITPLAIKKALEAIEKRNIPNTALRLGVKGGGCSGYSYVIQFDENTNDKRDLISFFGELKVVVDKKSALFLKGTTLDYQKTLMEHGFKFINPNEDKKCGCGVSFSLKQS